MASKPRLGYEFIADVDKLDEPANVEVIEEEFRAVRLVTTEEDSDGPSNVSMGRENSATVSVSRDSLHQRLSNRRKVVLSGIAAVALAVSAVSLALNFGGLRDRLLGRTSSPHIEALAVLPLQNLTGDPSQEYFVDGMTDELITSLGKITGLRVISRTSVMPYKKTTRSLPQIARELNVDAVIEGSVARAGNRVRITTQLIQASSDRRLWGERYERDLQDVLTLQGEVARAIAGEIRAEVTAQGWREQPTTQPRVNPEAYAFYLQGRALSHQDTEQDNQAAIRALEHAVALDPEFAPAHAALGRAYSDRLFAWQPKDEWKQKAETAIDKALSLDPNLAEAHVSRAVLLFTPAHGWQYEEAIRESGRALALNPNLAEGHLTLGVVFFHLGLLDEAVQEFQTTAAISPSLREAGLYTGFSLLFGGKFQEALPFIRTFKLSPFSMTLQAYDLWESGRKDEADGIIRELLKADPQEKFIGLACVHTLLLAESGNERELEERINGKILPAAEAEKSYGHFHHTANFVAEIYAQMNKPGEAVRWLEETAATGFPCYPFFERDRALDPIRRNPRFIAFMQKQKPQWEHLTTTFGHGGRSNY